MGGVNGWVGMDTLSRYGWEVVWNEVVIKQYLKDLRAPGFNVASSSSAVRIQYATNVQASMVQKLFGRDEAVKMGLKARQAALAGNPANRKLQMQVIVAKEALHHLQPAPDLTSNQHPTSPPTSTRPHLRPAPSLTSDQQLISPPTST
jgi:hypothetical protein